MATTRIVTFTYEDPSGTGIEGAVGTFALDRSTLFDAETIIPVEITGVSDSLGAGSVRLWTNGQGISPTHYVYTQPDGTRYSIQVPFDEESIAVENLIIQGLVLDWTDPDPGSVIASFRAELADTVNPALGDAMVGARHTGTGAVGTTVHAKLDRLWHARDFISTTETPVMLVDAFDTLEEAQAEYPWAREALFVATYAEALVIEPLLTEAEFDSQLIYPINDTKGRQMFAAIGEAGGGDLVVQPGRYRFSRRLVIPDGVVVRGTGVDVSVWDFNNSHNNAYAADDVIEAACCLAAQGTEPVELPALIGSYATQDDDEVMTASVLEHAIRWVFESDVSDALAVGDVIRIQNPADYSHSQYRPNYYAGEFVKVEGVDGDTVTLATRTFAPYDVDDIQLHKMSLTHATIRDMTIVGKTKPWPEDPEASLPTDPAVTYFRYATGLLTQNVELSGSNWIHVYVSQCYDAVIGAKVHYLPPARGLNYGVNINNSQNIIMLPECQLVTTRHGLSMGGADPNGVVTRNVHISGTYGGFGGSSTGSVATHANCEFIYFNDPFLQNGLTLSGDHLYGTVRIQTGANTIGIGGSEIVGAHIDLYVTIDVKAVPISVQGSARSIIGLNIQPDFVRGGTIRLRGTIDMGGHIGSPLLIYINGDDALVDCDISLNVTNVSPDATSCISTIGAAAGVKVGRITWHDCQLEAAEIRLDGAGPQSASFSNITIHEPNAAGIQVLANPLTQQVYQTRKAINDVWSDMGITYSDDPPYEQEVGSSQFTLAAAGDAIYLGYVTPWSQVAIAFAGSPSALVNTTPRTLTWEYYDGSSTWDDDDAWVSLPDISDGTILTGAPFGQDGVVSWTIPEDWTKVRVGNRDRDRRGSNRLYWVRARTSGSMTLAQFGTNTVTTPQPVTEEHFDILGCAISGGRGPAVSINATSQLFSTARILNSKLNNNGSNPSGGTSDKNSFFASDLLMLEVAGNWVGDTRAPSATNEASIRLWRVDDTTSFYERANINVNPTGLLTVTETNVVYRLTSMDSGRRRQAPGLAAPTTGTWLVNDVIWNTSTPSAAKNIAFWSCITSGTFGTLGGSVTATTSAPGSALVTVSSLGTGAGLQVGQFIMIANAGLGVPGVQIQDIDGLVLRVSPVVPTQVTGEAVTYSPPVFGASGRGRGLTSQRPTLTAGDNGFLYMDIDLHKVIHWYGTGLSWDV